MEKLSIQLWLAMGASVCGVIGFAARYFLKSYEDLLKEHKSIIQGAIKEHKEIMRIRQAKLEEKLDEVVEAMTTLETDFAAHIIDDKNQLELIHQRIESKFETIEKEFVRLNDHVEKIGTKFDQQFDINVKLSRNLQVITEIFKKDTHERN